MAQYRLFFMSAHGGILEYRKLPPITILPGKPSHLKAIAPSVVKCGVPFDVSVAVYDMHRTLAVDFTGNLSLSSHSDAVEISQPVMTMNRRDYAHISFGGVRISEEGTYHLKVTADNGLEAGTNPVMAVREYPELMPYWGDLHTHTQFSIDARCNAGENNTPYEMCCYAREVAMLDFVAVTDHHYAGEAGLTESEWERTNHDCSWQTISGGSPARVPRRGTLGHGGRIDGCVCGRGG